MSTSPSRKVSGYTSIVPTPDYGSGLDKPNALTQVDYVVFCGFGNDITAAINTITGEYITETAADYFPRLGYEIVPRSAVPADLAASVEFTSACSASAIVMQRALP